MLMTNDAREIDGQISIRLTAFPIAIQAHSAAFLVAVAIASAPYKWAAAAAHLLAVN